MQPLEAVKLARRDYALACVLAEKKQSAGSSKAAEKADATGNFLSPGLQSKITIDAAGSDTTRMNNLQIDFYRKQAKRLISRLRLEYDLSHFPLCEFIHLFNNWWPEESEFQ